MSLFYSKINGGFYDSEIHDILPIDAVEISKETHQALFAGQAIGKIISCDDSGYPVLIDRPAPTLTEIQAAQIALITTDYRAAIQADIDYMGATFNADYDTQNLMVSTLSAGQVPSEFFWQDITNSQITMTYAQAQGLLLAISERRQLAFDKLQTLKSAIRAAVDVDAVALIVW